MKHVHVVDLGQWPPACAIIGNKRAYHRFMRGKCGGDAKVHRFPKPNAGHCEMLAHGQECWFVIAVGAHEFGSELACTLAHEATHLMRWLFEHIGEKAPGTEAEAYLVEHIVREGLKALNKPPN
jgi:hypothetical protein